MIDILGLVGSPVGVRLLPPGAEAPAGATALKHHRYCQAVMRARRGAAVTLDGAGLSCPAAAAFGFRTLPAQLASGKALLGFGIVADPAVGRRIFEAMPKLEPGRIGLLHLFPLDRAEHLPDVVVLEDEIEKLMWVVLAYLHATGGERVTGTTAVLQAVCAGLDDRPADRAAAQLRLRVLWLSRGERHRTERDRRRLSHLAPSAHRDASRVPEREGHSCFAVKACARCARAHAGRGWPSTKGGRIVKRSAMTIIMLCVLGLGLASAALAQPGLQWRGGAGWGRGGAYNRLYDPKTVETVSGEVVKVEQMTPMKGMGYGVHLILKTDKETIPVHLGPAWYIERQDIKISAGDKVEVKGSRIAFDGKPAIIAAEIHKGDETLVLRDDAGVPAWAGWRRRQ